MAVKQFSKRGIKWSDPPPRAVSTGHVGRYEKFFEALREHPEQWAQWPVLVKYSSVASAINSGAFKGAEQGEFEAATRKAGNGKLRVYVRYIGNR